MKKNQYYINEKISFLYESEFNSLIDDKGCLLSLRDADMYISILTTYMNKFSHSSI